MRWLPSSVRTHSVVTIARSVGVSAAAIAWALSAGLKSAT